jgi:hypothetical protein
LDADLRERELDREYDPIAMVYQVNGSQDNTQYTIIYIMALHSSMILSVVILPLDVYV